MRELASNFDSSVVIDGRIVCSVRLIDFDVCCILGEIQYLVNCDSKILCVGGVFYVMVVYLNEWDDWYGFCGID